MFFVFFFFFSVVLRFSVSSPSFPEPPLPPGPQKKIAAGISHDSPKAQTCTLHVPGVSSITKIPREDPQREREREKERKKENNNGSGRGKKKREILCPLPFGAPRFGAHMSHTRMAKNGLAKIGQIRMAKKGLAKVGLFPLTSVLGLFVHRFRWLANWPQETTWSSCAGAPDFFFSPHNLACSGSVWETLSHTHI